ncbi:MAG: hypothetical protein AB7R55_09995, partial [Gemmatimonadales bacterium]
REDHRQVLDKLPGMVEQVLVRALRMRPEDRFEGPRELVLALAAAFERTARFPEGQARAIVARAAEIEATAPTEGGSLSLAGIQRVAAEVGIAPEHVAEAAREAAPAREGDSSILPYLNSLGSGPLSVPDRGPVAPIEANPFLGSPTRIQVERVVDGEVEEADYVTLVEECRMRFGNVGQGSTLGRSLAWRTVVPVGQSGRHLSMTVTPRAGKTTIRIDESLTPVAGGLFGGLMGGVGGSGIAAGLGIGMGALHSPIAALAIIVTILTGSYGAARGFLHSTHRKRTAELERLADRLAAFLSEGGSKGRPLIPR